MNFIFNYLFNPFLNWGVPVFGLAVIFVAALKMFRNTGFFSKISHKFLIWSVVIFKIIFASIETFEQYFVWKSGDFTKLFLDSKTIDFGVLREFSGKLFWIFNNKFGYLLFYSWGRFWMQIAVSLAVAALFYVFLKFLKKHKERFFKEGEVELGFLLALVVGWPNFIIFLFATFGCVVLVSIFRMIFFKELYTTLGAPFLLAALLSLIFGNYFIDLFRLAMFRV